MVSGLREEYAQLQLLTVRRIAWNVGHVVRALRDDEGWTQPQLARRAGLNKATINSVEQMDRNHGRETYEKIALAFGLTMAQLFAMVPGSGENEPKETPRAPRTPDATAGNEFPKR